MRHINNYKTFKINESSEHKKEDIEDYVINLIDSCDKELYKEGYLYKKDDKLYFYQDDENKRFFYDWDSVYKDLKSKFGLNNQEQKDLIKGILERHYNLRGYTNRSSWPYGSNRGTYKDSSWHSSL